MYLRFFVVTLQIYTRSFSIIRYVLQLSYRFNNRHNGDEVPEWKYSPPPIFQLRHLDYYYIGLLLRWMTNIVDSNCHKSGNWNLQCTNIKTYQSFNLHYIYFDELSGSEMNIFELFCMHILVWNVLLLDLLSLRIHNIILLRVPFEK